MSIGTVPPYPDSVSDASSHIADQRHYLSIRSHSRGWGLGLWRIDWEGGVECNPFQMLLFKKQFVLSEEATKNMFSLLQYKPGRSTMLFTPRIFCQSTRLKFFSCTFPKGDSVHSPNSLLATSQSLKDKVITVAMWSWESGSSLSH